MLREGIHKKNSGIYYVEELSKNTIRIIKVSRIYASYTSGHHKIDFVETVDFGPMLFIDNKAQLSKSDEYIYHESLVHPTLFSHPNPRKILIIGGGDGGTLREVLKHNCVERVTLVDLDRTVIEASQKHMPYVSKGAFNDRRVETVISDGMRYIEHTNENFDVIILDLTDPIGDSKKLYTLEFYRKSKERLRENGILATHAESPYLLQTQFLRIYKTLKTVFKYTRAYGSWIPSFGLHWMFVIASDYIDPSRTPIYRVTKRLKERKVKTHYYHPKLHKKLFILPKDIEQAIKNKNIKISTIKDPVTLE
jgi:spermidine synthase